MKNTTVKMTKNERENFIFDSIMAKYNNDGSNIDLIDQIQLLDIIRPNMHKSGKIENISSFDSAVLTCSFCQKMHENGKHDLGSAGEANPYKGGIDEGLIGPEYYSSPEAGPAVIERRTIMELEDAA